MGQAGVNTQVLCVALTCGSPHSPIRTGDNAQATGPRCRHLPVPGRKITGVTTTRSPLVVVHGPVIRHLRRRTTDHTVITLAAAVGLTFSHLAKIERGDVRSVRPEVLAALVDALSVKDERVLLAQPYRATPTVAHAAVLDAAA